MLLMLIVHAKKLLSLYLLERSPYTLGLKRIEPLSTIEVRDQLHHHHRRYPGVSEDWHHHSLLYMFPGPQEGLLVLSRCDQYPTTASAL